MAVSQNSFTGNGSTTTYSFTFPYLKSADIKASIDAVVTTAFTLPTATTLQFNTAPANNTKIKIYRETGGDALTATFYAGSAIKSEDLNDNFTQNLYTTQEISDRYLSSLAGTMVGNLTMGEDTEIIFEGATDNAYETTLAVTDPTADRTITLPNVTGTVVTTGDTGTVTSAMIANNTIVAGDIAGNTITPAEIAPNAVTSSELADNAVQTSNISDAQVTTAKIANGAVGETQLANAGVSNAKLAANAVGTSNIAANAVTGAKINPDSILNGHIADGQIDSEHYVAGSIDSVYLANGAVTNAKMADNSVDTAELVSNAVTLAKMADNSVGTSELVNDAVTTVKIAANAITSTELAAGSVGTSHIGNNQIINEKIADGAVTGAKIADNTIFAAQIGTSAIGNDELGTDAVTAAKIAADAVGTSELADAELVTLAGMQSGTASILASSTALTSTTAELNLLDGKSVVTSVSGSSTDVQLPTAKAVNDQIVAIVQDIGGFYPIADELKFPNTNPDPNDDAGTIVSIADAGGIVVNGSGVSTTGRTLGGATVTINGIDSTLNNTTIAAGKGMLVQTTSTLNTYDYHRLIVDEAGVASAQTLVTDFNQRYQVAGSTPTQQPDGTALAEGDLFFDTGSNKMKVYDGSNYAEVTSVGDYKLLTIVNDGQTSGTPTFNGSIVSYDLRDGGSAASVTAVGQLLVSLNGVLQKPNSGSYSASEEGFYLEGSNGIKFCTAPPSGSSVFVTLIGSATTINTPGTNSVAEATIQTNVVSEEKLKVSNSPTNGYFLQAQSGNSGGLTWAEADTTTIPVADESTDTSCNVVFVTAATGSLPPKTGTNLTFNSNTGQLSATSYAGDGSALTGVAAAVADGCIFENDQTISNNYTIASGKGAHSVGPITVNATVTVNGNWVVS